MRPNSPFIVRLDELACQNIALTGGKAANLAQLAASYPVPAGFCVTTAAYKAYSPAVFNGNDNIDALRTVIANAYEQLSQHCDSPTPYFAVRSSAVAEDGHQASFAGQYETYLNLTGVDAIVDAITRCWQSSHSQQVLDYQQRQENITDLSLAVLIQMLIPADVAFVAFSSNPITNNLQEMVINANWGLGESIVNATVIPDSITVQKKNTPIVEYIVADKRCLTIRSAEGMREINMPKMLRKKASLNTQQIEEISQLLKALEDKMGWPVDIEGAYHDDVLYLLQCRPIVL